MELCINEYVPFTSGFCVGPWGPIITRPSYLRMVISMLKIRRPLGRLIFNMGIAIPGKTVFLIETAPRPLYQGYFEYVLPFNRTYVHMYSKALI